MSLADIHIKNEYRSLLDNVVTDFYIPVLQESILYQRAVGFFSSSALIAISKGVEGLVANGGKIQIIASPRLSQEDIDEISKGYEVRKIIERALLRGVVDPSSIEESERLSYNFFLMMLFMSWMKRITWAQKTIENACLKISVIGWAYPLLLTAIMMRLELRRSQGILGKSVLFIL